MRTRKPSSPIPGACHAVPGESVQAELEDLLFGKLFILTVVAFAALGMAAAEWYSWYVDAPRSPMTASIFASLFLCYAAIRIWNKWPAVRQLRLARKGELAVGQLLEVEASRYGGRVFHDIPMREGRKVLGNIDHVLVCRKGIFAIETKTWSKGDGDCIHFDGEKIRINGIIEPDRDPVVQAKANARWLRDLLNELTGKRVPVRPVVMFPGWFVDASGRKIASRTAEDLWVLSARALPGFLEKEETCLSAEQIDSIAGPLSRDLRRQRSCRCPST